MKIQILIIILLNLLAKTTVCQNLTKIAGFIDEAKDSTMLVQLYINNPKIINNEYTPLEVRTENGFFSFEFLLDDPSMIVLNVNGINIFSPGVYHLLIEPTDSLNFHIVNIKTPGLLNINVSGRGVSKIDFTKAMIASIFPIYKTDQTDPRRKSLQFRFETTEKKLNVIDSVSNLFQKSIRAQIRNIITGYEYHYTLDLPLLFARNSDNDSVRYFFDKYIVKKNRMHILLKKDVVNYIPYHVLGNFVLLSAFTNPAREVGLSFIQKRPVDFANLIVKHFRNNIYIKDYLLADLMIKKMKNEMLSSDTKVLFEYYNKNVSPNSLFYEEVQNLYKYFSSRLSTGTPFFKFKLADTVGNFYNLDDFAGKVLVLDFWFYGCSGCAQITKVLDSLENRFDKGNIQFASISIDTKKTWLAGIGKYSSLNSLNLYTSEQGSSHPLIKYLNFSTYPKLVVIDRKGNLVGSPPDPRTKKEEFVKFINSL